MVTLYHMDYMYINRDGADFSHANVGLDPQNQVNIGSSHRLTVNSGFSSLYHKKLATLNEIV